MFVWDYKILTPMSLMGGCQLHNHTAACVAGKLKAAGVGFFSGSAIFLGKNIEELAKFLVFCSLKHAAGPHFPRFYLSPYPTPEAGLHIITSHFGKK